MVVALRHRRALSLGMGAGVVCLAGAIASFACGGHPYAEVGNTTDEGGSDASGADVATDAPDARDGAPEIGDATAPDAPVLGDGGMKVDASGCMSCDCDSDGYNDLAKAGCADAGGVQDCDDTDSRTHPNQDFLDSLAEPPRNGDWNCSTLVERYYPVNVSCGSVSFGATCDATFGFTDNPACGVAGMLVKCKSVGTPPLNLDGKCVVATQSATKQPCK